MWCVILIENQRCLAQLPLYTSPTGAGVLNGRVIRETGGIPGDEVVVRRKPSETLYNVS